MSDDHTHGHRLDRVEGEVSSIRGEIGTLTRDVGSVQSDVKGLGAILGRIETGVERAQAKNDDRLERSKPNLTAVVSVLITIISILVGGAWLIGGQLAALSVRTEELGNSRTERAAERAATDRRFERLEDRQMRGSDRPAF